MLEGERRPNAHLCPKKAKDMFHRRRESRRAGRPGGAIQGHIVSRSPARPSCVCPIHIGTRDFCFPRSRRPLFYAHLWDIVPFETNNDEIESPATKDMPRGSYSTLNGQEGALWKLLLAEGHEHPTTRKPWTWRCLQTPHRRVRSEAASGWRGRVHSRSRNLK